MKPPRLGVVLLALAALPAFAGEGYAPAGAFVQYGATDHANEATFGLTWDLPWQKQLERCTLSAYVEAAIGRWSSHGEFSSSVWYTQLGLTPVLRVKPKDAAAGWFAEAGIGANVIAPLYHSGDKRFSTSFNFGDHVAVGREFGEHREHELALRLQHFSNGGIRHPNPGENFLQLRYLKRF